MERGSKRFAANYDAASYPFTAFGSDAKCGYESRMAAKDYVFTATGRGETGTGLSSLPSAPTKPAPPQASSLRWRTRTARRATPIAGAKLLLS